MKKIICLLLSIITAFSVSSMFACGGKSDGGANVIEINYWKAGLGDAYFKQIVSEFKKAYPEYEVDVNYLAGNNFGSDFAKNITTGAKYNTVDLYFGPDMDISYNKYLEPLNAVLDEVNGGETKKVGEKISADLLDCAQSADGTYYALPYGGGVCGIVYNNTLMQEVLADSGLSLPKTTDELAMLASAITTKYKGNRKAFIHFNAGYWEYIQDVWQAQYDGLEQYEEFYRLGAALNTIGTKNETPDKSVLLREDGRVKVLEVFESILASRFVDRDSNDNEMPISQTKFVNGDAVMMVNGAWFVNETKGLNSPYTDFRLMKTPVISSIIEKCDTIEDDETLSAVISAVDEGENGYPSVSEEDFLRVKNARNLIWQVFSQHSTCIPNYATAKEGAKKFVKFYYSDIAQKIFSDTVHIALPFTYDKEENMPDISGWSNYEKDAYGYSTTMTMLGVANGKRSSLFTRGGLYNYPRLSSNSIVYLMSRSTEPKSANAVWNEMKTLYNSSWSTYISRAGL
ncbi:MAG: extracellular solute-binding protein [Clostridia bacterium]|nr:extracellular solute-binding protein [Clostridia bacterium]